MIICHLYSLIGNSLIDQPNSCFSILIIGAILACFVTIMTIYGHYFFTTNFIIDEVMLVHESMSLSYVYYSQSTATSSNIKFVVKQVVPVALLWQFRVWFFIIRVKPDGMIEQIGGCAICGFCNDICNTSICNWQGRACVCFNVSISTILASCYNKSRFFRWRILLGRVGLITLATN